MNENPDFSSLANAALLGTARGTPPPLPSGTPLTDAINAVDGTDAEAALLSRAALIFLHEQAGRLPPRDLQPAPVAAAAETLPQINAAAAAHLGQIFFGDYAELLPEWLRLCGQAQCLAPPEWLPTLLRYHADDLDFQALTLPVLGERGRWLAKQSPTWSWVLGEAPDEDVSAWETGESPARRALLRRVRLRDPAQARELLAATWNTEALLDRIAFVQTIGLNLQPEDESFLESCLTDNRKEVRMPAMALLSRLPVSAWSQRMLARAEPLLTFTPAASGSLLKLKKTQPAVLEANFPDNCDKEMQRDGIEPKPLKGTGEKAWWLIQLLTAAPLSAWEKKWNLAPSALVAAAQAGESGKEIVRGWYAAAVAQENAAWAEALLDVQTEARTPTILLGLLPAERQEQYYMKALTSDQGGLARLTFHFAREWSMKTTWSPAFSRTLLDCLRTFCAESLDRSSSTLRRELQRLALHLHPTVLPEAPSGWPTVPGEAWTYWQPGIESFLQLCQVRADMHAAFKPAA